MIKKAHIIYDPSVRDLCRRRYPGHPRGCPNYGERAMCPPKALLIGDVLDLSKPAWVVWVEFDIEAQRNRMWAKHPNWSKRRAGCCLYWQGGVRKQLSEEMARHAQELATNLVNIEVPEAMGVNVTETMRNIGVELEWPPEQTVRKVGLIGFSRQGS